MIAENNPLSTANEIIRLTKSGYYIKQALDKIGVSNDEFLNLIKSQPALAEHISKNFLPYLEMIMLADIKEVINTAQEEPTGVKKKRGKNTMREDK